MVILPSIRRKYMTRRDPGGKIPLGDAVITLDKDVWQYTGSAITPTPVVTLYGNLLTVNVDFTVGYTGNVEVGQGVVTVTGMGQYSGQRQKSFVIEAAPAPTGDDWDFDISQARYVGAHVISSSYATAGRSHLLASVLKSGADSQFMTTSSANGYKLYSVAFPPDASGEYHVENLGDVVQHSNLQVGSEYIAGVSCADASLSHFIARGNGTDYLASLDASDPKRIEDTVSLTGEIGSGVVPYKSTEVKCFNSDGTKMYGVYANGGGDYISHMRIVNLHVPFSVAGVTSSDVETFQFPNTSPLWAKARSGCFSFSPSGKQAIMMYSNSGWKLRLYKMAVPYDLENAVFGSELDYKTIAETDYELCQFIVVNGGKTLLAVRYDSQYKLTLVEFSLP